MVSPLLRDDGRLTDENLPAMYFDSSALVPYWLAKDIKTAGSATTGPAEPPYMDLLMKVLKAEEKIRKMLELRQRLEKAAKEKDQVKVLPVYSPLCLLEFFESHAGTFLKQVASTQLPGLLAIERLARKGLGDSLSDLVELLAKEYGAAFDAGKTPDKTTPIWQLVNRISPSKPSVLEGLRGIVPVEIVNFGSDFNRAWEDGGFYAPCRREGQTFCTSISPSI